MKLGDKVTYTENMEIINWIHSSKPAEIKKISKKVQ